MNTPREFTSAAEMRAFYSALKKRMNYPARPEAQPPVAPPLAPEPEPAPAIDPTPATAPRRYPMRARVVLKQVIARHTGYSIEVLQSPQRTPEVVEARKLLFWLSRQLVPNSAADIGRWISKDGSTVRQAILELEGRRAINSSFAFRTDAMLVECQKLMAGELR